MPNQMLDSLFCECGGKYEHVDSQRNNNGSWEDSFQCDQCETWCITTWKGDQEIGRRYEEPEAQEEEDGPQWDIIEFDAVTDQYLETWIARATPKQLWQSVFAGREWLANFKPEMEDDETLIEAVERRLGMTLEAYQKTEASNV